MTDTALSLELTAREYLKNREREDQMKARYAAQGAWVRYVLCCFVQRRPHAFAEIQHRLSDSLYWKFLGRLLNRSALTIDRRDKLARNFCLPYQNAALWYSLLTSKRAEREAFTRSLDRATWNALPEQITIFRGAPREGDTGAYFSIRRDIAEWYCGLAWHGDVHKGQRIVHELQVSKCDCLFYGGRSAALLYLPRLRDAVLAQWNT